MKKICFLLFASLFVACDDGDIITEEFDFDDTGVSICEPFSTDVTDQAVLYKNKTDTREALILSFTEIGNVLTGDYADTLDLSATNILQYRRFNTAPNADYFCSLIPPNEPRVEEVFEAVAGRIVITTIAVDDDGDGIPRELEQDADGNDIDTDGDNIPNYLDIDDDGDNVPTVNEGVVISGDDLILITESRNTDLDLPNGDNILDYLDADDDGDGILSKQEDIGGDLGPADDRDALDEIAYYLDPSKTQTAFPEVTERILHTFEREYLVSIRIIDLVLSNGSEEFIFDSYDFGTYTSRVFTLEH